MYRILQGSALSALVAVASLASAGNLARGAEGNDLREDKHPSDQNRLELDALDKQAPWITEAVRVTARGTANDYPSALATQVITFQEAIGSPADFQDLITRVPGVGATGQNGLFETFSIRGSGANNILILVGGMPITAQRRAGVPVAFVEPALLGDINVTRGPSVAHFGAGALGGAVSIEPRWFDTPFTEGGYATSGEESSMTAGYGSGNFSFAASHHEAGDSQSPNGTPLDTSFRRDSATIQMRTEWDDYALDALLLPSRTQNIGKSNTRFPARVTTYPEDSHTLGRVRLRNANGFEAALRVHEQYLGTHKQRAGRPDEFAAVSSTDLGSTLQQTFELGKLTGNIGVEYLGREDVDAYDAVASTLNRTYSLKDGSEDGWSLFALGDWRASSTLALELGGRLTRVSQDHAGIRSSDSGHALTAGLVYSSNDWSRWTLNLASGFRFPTLEERFYTGVTAQGEVIGNPNLAAEHSAGIDLGYAVDHGHWGGELHLWRTNVDDLIQLIDIEADVNGFVNIGHARLFGGEAALAWTPLDAWSLRGSMAVVRGTDNSGRPLYGIPPVTADIEARYRTSRIELGARISHRWPMDRPGFEELARSAVTVVDADFRYHFTPALNVQVYLRNALNEEYFATSDELSTYAPGRSIGLTLHWTMH